MKLLLGLVAASSMCWFSASPAAAQSPVPMDTLGTDSGVYRVSAMKTKKLPRSRPESSAADSAAVAAESTPKGHTDFDPDAVAGDRAAKAAKLAQAERERNPDIRSGRAPCVLKPVMTDAEIAACRE